MRPAPSRPPSRLWLLSALLWLGPQLGGAQNNNNNNNNRLDSADAETFYIRKGANGTLPCLPVVPGDSQAAMNKIEWFKEEHKLVEAEAKHIVVWNTKNSIAYLPESGALLFRGVANEDSGEYRCSLTRVSAGQVSADEGVVRFYVQDVPDPPQMPIIIAFTQRSVNISWVPGHDYHFSPILHYVIHVREGIAGHWNESNGVMTPDNRTQFQIIGLKPFTTYSFRVLAVNAIGVGEPSPVSHYIITLRQKPDSLLNIISARNISSTAIRLEWLAPAKEQIHGEFLGYRIRYVAQLHEHAPPANQSGAEPEPDQAAAAEPDRWQTSSAAAGRAQPAPPPRPPQQPSLDGPLAREVVVGEPGQTSYVIKNLQIFTPYRISVQVSNPAGDGPVAEVLAMTDQGVPSEPLELSVLKVLDTQVKLRWLEPRAPNGILEGYQVNLLDIGQNLSDTRKLSDPQAAMEHTIGQLTPHTWYKATIQAYSRKFLGEHSQPVKFRTDVSAPSAPALVNVTCDSADSLRVQWQRPRHYYNQLDYYYVQYRLQAASQPPPPASGWEVTTLAAKRDKQLNELLITNLTAEQLYELKVIAGTRSVLDPANLVYKSEPSQTYRVVLQPNCEGE